MPIINLNKKTIFFLIIILWIGFSVIYIALDLWNDFKFQEINRAFESGRVETINQIIQQTVNRRCEPVRIFNEETEVNLIDMACVQQEQLLETESPQIPE